ncbi:transposase [Streptomyces sp. NRRL B-1677]|uniref:transposase n=1 Tax=Streptomyces sp. NRRL B-1677 TaxID=2682966 RepID=UPI002B4B7D26|nr:transposase [Streptomyces sp. NRRL B-1677]
MRCRIDFKYALAMDLDDPGFHHSVLTDFRARLAEEGRADRLLDLALERIKAAGLVKERGRQRTDSTHILAAVRDLTRIELVTEAMRAALEELARRAPQELVGLVTDEWGQRYGRAARLGKNPTHPKTRIKYLGEDAYLLLRYTRTYLRGLWDGPQIQALRLIFLQNYFIDSRERVQWREPDETGRPPSATAVVSPYDLTARYARRGGTRWRGFLAHVTESCDDGAVNIITDVTTTPAPVYDTRSLPVIHTCLEHRNLLPAEHLVDGGYTSVALRDRAAREHQIYLVGPVRKKITRKGNVFDRDAFNIDWEQRQVTCPQGQVSSGWSSGPSIAPAIQAQFSKKDCGLCPVKANCTRSTHQMLTFHPRELHELLTVARAEQHTSAWQKRYAMRAGAEGTINEFVRGHGMRQSRYRGHDKVHVQHVLTTIAINVERISAQHTPPDSTADRHPRPPATFQDFLDRQRIPRPRGVGSCFDVQRHRRNLRASAFRARVLRTRSAEPCPILTGPVSRGGRASTLDGFCDLQCCLCGREVSGVDDLGLTV